MKNLQYIIGLFLTVTALFSSCDDSDEYEFGDIISPTNLEITAVIVGADENNPNGDGSGEVHFTATASNTTSFQFIYNESTVASPTGKKSYIFSTLGLNTYTVTVVATGTAGVKTSKTISVDVLATYAPPADLLEKLIGDGTKTWRIKSDKKGHFGLGPVGGIIPTEWYSAGAGEKSATGMYDDHYIFNADGTFTHIVNSLNDDPVEDTSGTIFGRDGLVDELGPHNETPNGADIENYPYEDYSETWALIAPGGVETITLTGLGFIGYYTGGNHNYEIFDRSVEGELLIKTADGNGEFDWWFILTDQ